MNDKPLKVLYLDFDGVLHPQEVFFYPKRKKNKTLLDERLVKKGHRLFEHNTLLAELLEPYPDVKIVLSTSWVRQLANYSAARRKTTVLKDRVIGATWHTAMQWDVIPYSQTYRFLQLSRLEQIYADVQRRKPDVWLALDDDVSLQENTVVPFSEKGISEQSIKLDLIEKLKRFA